MAERLVIASGIEKALWSRKAPYAFYAGGTIIEGLTPPKDLKTLIWLKQIPEMTGIEAAPKGQVRIGALTTFQEALTNDLTPSYLRTALAYMASLPRRCKATVGGNIAAARPDSYLAPVLWAAGAILETADVNEEERVFYKDLAVCKYLSDPARYGERLILAVRLPGEGQIRLASRRYANTALSHACLTMALSVKGDERVCAFGLAGAGLAGSAPEDFEEAFERAGAADDFFGSAAYKHYLARVTLGELSEELCGNLEKGGGAV